MTTHDPFSTARAILEATDSSIDFSPILGGVEELEILIRTEWGWAVGAHHGRSARSTPSTIPRRSSTRRNPVRRKTTRREMQRQTPRNYG